MPKHSLVLLVSLMLAQSAWSAVPTALDLSSSKSKVEFLAIGKPSALKIRGELSEEPKAALRGEIQLASDSLSGTARLSLASLTTGISLRDSHMKDNYLHVAKFPEATLSLDKISLPATLAAGDGEASDLPFSGKLLLHGVEKPVAGSAHVHRKGDNLGLKLAFRLKLSDFAIEIPSYLGIKVADEVEVSAESEGKLVAKTSPLP